jgi:hypothetical protein
MFVCFAMFVWIINADFAMNAIHQIQILFELSEFGEGFHFLD